MQGAERPGDYRRKKTLALALALALALSIVGCGGKKESANTPDSNKPSSNEASNKPPSELTNQALATGPGKASRTIKYWDVEFGTSRGVDTQAKPYGDMKDVKGVIYVNGTLTYSFQSGYAQAFKEHDRLYLLYDVKVTNEVEKKELPGDGFRVWDPQKSKFITPPQQYQTWDISSSEPGRLSRNAHLWDIEWQSANLVIKQVDTPSGEKKSKQFGTMNSAKGVVYKDGQIASTFQTDLAEAFEADDRLKLSGKVVLTAFVIDKKDKSKKTTVLTANEVSWDPLTQRYTASGNVEVDGPNGYLAPTDKVFATAKLDRIATSEDYFKK